MIGHLEGTVRKISIGSVILSCGGVGYKIAATKESLARLRLNETAALWTHLAVREDVLDLYGFSTEEELHFFGLLLMVSGIGPKSALAILDIASVETLRSAIAAGNSGYLTNVSGIGKKTAEKIILELRDKVGVAQSETSAAISGDEETLEAMRALGYSLQEARDALRKVPMEIKNPNERLREALKSIGRS
ncbi:MAG: Holliday junction branch migration protein RuvA [Candidatus Pacebacteria bacterium]|nr:Holliday junction branch migration protein RuvA [Candidatus Paceibacterota bacterium]